jgi:hypothetical protein
MHTETNSITFRNQNDALYKLLDLYTRIIKIKITFFEE